MERNLIAKNNIQEYYDIGINIDDGRVDNHILKAQISDLQPILGSNLYRALVHDSKYYKSGSISMAGISSSITGNNNEYQQIWPVIGNGDYAEVQFDLDVASNIPTGLVGSSVLREVSQDGKPASVIYRGKLDLKQVGAKYVLKCYYEHDFINGKEYAFGFDLEATDPDPHTWTFSMFDPLPSTQQAYESDGLGGWTLVGGGTKNFVISGNLYKTSDNITFGTSKYWDLFYGKEYQYNGDNIYFRGVKPLLIAFAYSRLVGANNTFVTRGGIVEKTSEQSESKEDNQILQVARRAVSDALMYSAELIQFLSENISTYSLWNGETSSHRRTSFKITRSPGNQSIKQY